MKTLPRALSRGALAASKNGSRSGGLGWVMAGIQALCELSDQWFGEDGGVGETGHLLESPISLQHPSLASFQTSPSFPATKKGSCHHQAGQSLRLTLLEVLYSRC